MAKAKNSQKEITERRNDKRTKSTDIAITVDGKDYSTQNLSVGGAMINGYVGNLSAGALLAVTGVGPATGKVQKVDIQARVNRAIPDASQLVLTFLAVDEKAYEILQGIMADRIRILELNKDQP
ncbi:MAG: PilZ domain-containing protein [Rhodospirillales bacterium]|nr:PilZ domain-containing protein [Rhodospirillales bacterium]